jgi:hypothetical protein
MRISSDERDSGYAKWLEWGGHKCRARVFLDGLALGHCVTADEELGEVLVCCLNVQGNVYPDETGQAVAKEWRRGKVTIVMPETTAEWLA